ncbi:SMI1/KNR4 family protein [Serratia quinivorans]|uniref:SMI1/KNR4 family protein n=1 Tax=Serratia quinivorans TaxID=137545 RepID=UPI002E7A70A5|nr:SMI1/KNR4 family protein [Serratia quinivorans]
MNKDDILKEIEKIEKTIGIALPIIYKKFLSEEVQDSDAYEIKTKKGDHVYIYNYKDIIERNNTYTIKEFEPNYILIGQDGDIGYFISSKDNNEKIYSLDLGALGSLNMDEEGKDIYELRT